MKVISLYDFTGEAVRPWAEAGYKCYCYDIQHDYDGPYPIEYVGLGEIHYLYADLHDSDQLNDIYNEHGHEKVDF